MKGAIGIGCWFEGRGFTMLRAFPRPIAAGPVLSAIWLDLLTGEGM